MRVIIFMLSIIASIGVHAQKEAIFTASLEKDSIGAEELITVTFTIENVSPNGFQAPDFSAFEKVLGPNISTEFSMINGNFSQKATYTYRLIPKDRGVFKIPAASLTIEDDILQTEALKVTVLDIPETKPKKEPAEKKKVKGKIYRT